MEKEVRIDFKTQGDTDGAKEVEKSIKDVNEASEKAAESSESQAKKMADATIRRDTAITKSSKKSRKAIEEVGKASKNQASETKNSALDSSRALREVEEAAREIREQLDKIDGIDPKLRQQMEGVASSMEKAALSGRKMTTETARVGKSSKNTGLAVLEFSRAIEDAQFGIAGVLNNIPNLIRFLGGGAGLAGVISIAAVGLTQLFRLFSQGKEEIDKTSLSFEEMSKRVDGFADDINGVRFDSFEDQLEQIRRGLKLENEELKINQGLLEAKAAASRQIAAAQDDQERALIARRVITDDDFTEDDAQIARADLDLQKLERDRQEKITEQRAKAAAAQEVLTKELEEQARLAEQRATIEKEIQEIQNKLADIQRARLDSEVLLSEADVISENIDASSSTGRLIGRALTRRVLPDSVQKRIGFEAFKEPDSTFEDVSAKRREAGSLFNDAIASRQVALTKRLEDLEGSLKEIPKEQDIQEDIIITAQTQATAAAVESRLNIETINEVTAIQRETQIINADISTALKSQTSLINSDILPSIQSEIENSGQALDQGTQKILKGITDLSKNAIRDTDEQDQLITALSALQQRGISTSGMLISLARSTLAKQASLEAQVRDLASASNATRR